MVGRSGRFAFLFTKVGLSGGDMGAAYLLPRVVGLGRATELLMLGDTIDAETADRYGLVSELVADEGLDEAVAALAAPLAAARPSALAQTKSLLTRELDMSLSARDGAGRDDPGPADDHRRTTPSSTRRSTHARRPPDCKGRDSDPAASPAGTAKPCTSTRASASHSRLTPMPAMAG